MAMFLNKFKIRPVAAVSAKFSVSNFCSSTTTTSANINKSVFVSQSKDIFTNLALEDWLYRNYDLTNHHVLLLWQNDPCVVIGRHQNPWLEANVPELPRQGGVKLARRNSGGGTVYHDPGNLNMTFFTSRQHYDRNANLQLITAAVFKEFGTKLDISARHDLTVAGCKVSGTAAKLGRPNSYHHCTLLVDVNKTAMSRSLQKLSIVDNIKTNATKSTRSQIVNLSETNRNIDMELLLKAIGREYLQEGRPCLFHMINPTDEQRFPGISDIRSNLESWQWRYGKTPTFSVSQSFTNDSKDNFEVTVTVESGRISNIVATSSVGPISVIGELKGSKFPEDALDHLESSIEGLVGDKDDFVANCIKQVMTPFAYHIETLDATINRMG